MSHKTVSHLHQQHQQHRHNYHQQHQHNDIDVTFHTPFSGRVADNVTGAFGITVKNSCLECMKVEFRSLQESNVAANVVKNTLLLTETFRINCGQQYGQGNKLK